MLRGSETGLVFWDANYSAERNVSEAETSLGFVVDEFANEALGPREQMGVGRIVFERDYFLENNVIFIEEKFNYTE